jgi:KaiC/GvpD/RAD55 family RecA-like ATPase
MSTINLHDLQSQSINFDIESYNEIFEEYDSDLRNYIEAFKSKDKSEYQKYAAKHLLNKLVEKWQPLLGFSSERILADIRDKQTPKNNFKASMTIREAVNQYKPGGNWLIPNLLRTTGLYILGGEPKTGKSLLAYHLLYSMTVSQKFLDRPVKPGKVLFLQLEEPEETIAERLFYTGFGDIADEETSLILNFKDIGRIERQFDATSTADINWLINTILEYQPALTIIDSLRKATMNSSASENSNEMGKLVYALQQVFNFTGTCGILIHHMNKPSGGKASSKKSSLIERLAGHTSISSASDGIIGLMAQETDYGRLITLKTLPRNGTAIVIDYTMTQTEGGIWELEKIYEDTPASNPITIRILRFLSQTPGQYYSLKKIASQINSHYTDKSFKDSLNYLQASQIITSKYVSVGESRKSFVYTISEDSTWIVNPTNISEDLQTPVILDANGLMKQRTKRELRKFIKEVGRDRYYAALEVLFDEEVARLEALKHTWEFSIGDKVMYDNEECTVSKQVGVPRLVETYYELEEYEGQIIEYELTPIEIPSLYQEGDEDSLFNDIEVENLLEPTSYSQKQESSMVEDADSDEESDTELDEETDEDDDEILDMFNY